MGNSSSKKSHSKRDNESEENVPHQPKRIPIKKPKTCTWGLRISAQDVNKICAGFQPQSMDEKWLCEADEPTLDGEVVAHFYRSWTMDEKFRFRIVPSQRGGATITEFTYDGHFTEEDAKGMTVMVCNCILECHINAPSL